MRTTCNIIVLLLLLQSTARSQNGISPSQLEQLSSKFTTKINSKIAGLQDQVTKKTEKYLQRIAKQEKKLKSKLEKVDSASANQLFSNNDQYEKLIDGIKTASGNKAGIPKGEYLPYIDSLKSMLSFLHQDNELAAGKTGIQNKIGNALSGVNQLQNKLQQSEQIQSFLRQRKQQIKEALAGYTKLSKSITKSLANYNKEFYYYSQQIAEYKELFNNPEKLEQKALTLLNRLPAFQEFMKAHSELAGLFGIPANYGNPQSLAGLQTRVQVQQLIQNQLSSAGPNAQQILQQNLQAAQSQLNKLKDKISKPGNGSSDIDMPDFKPNNQRTKSFFRRLEYGTNLQTAKSNIFWPTTTDLGLSVGYKLNDNSTVGIGTSYKVGWGKDIRNIVVTNEGIGFRSFADVKLKGSFYASGGFEYNYQKPFSSIQSINDLNKWQQSGLIGISKVVSLKSKLFKKTRLQLLWDFLSYQQLPQTQALKFRVGYNF